MRIVVTVHTYWPKRDGVQYVTQYLCEGLVRKGHEVTVITTVPNRAQVSLEIHNGVRIKRVYLKTKYSVFNFGVKEYVNSVIEEVETTDVFINCCVQSPNNNVILPILHKVDAVKILYMHGIHEFKLQNNGMIDNKYRIKHFFMNVRWGLFYKLQKRRFWLYDGIIDIHSSSTGLSFMRNLGCHAKQYIITNAVEDFSSVQISDCDLRNYPVLGESFFLNVANFNERKNQLMLIEAYRGIPNKDDVKLVLIGGKSNYSEIVKLRIAELQLQNSVFVYEDLDREKTRMFIKKCLCGVMSSRFEVYPIFICESISCGHPFITTDVGCVSEIPGGLIANETEEFSQMMQSIISNERIKEELGERGLEFAKKHFSQSSKTNELEGIFFDLQEERNKAQ